MTDTYLSAQVVVNFALLLLKFNALKDKTTFQIIHPNDKLMTVMTMYEVTVTSRDHNNRWPFKTGTKDR